jgi:hypothetical protein
VKPPKQRAARRPRKRSAKLRLFATGCLTDEQNAADSRAPDDGGPVQARTPITRAQGGEMAFEVGTGAERGHKKARAFRTALERVRRNTGWKARATSSSKLSADRGSG